MIGEDEGGLSVGENGQEVEYGVFGAEYNNDVDHRIGPLYGTDVPQGAHARSRPLRGARDGLLEGCVSAFRVSGLVPTGLDTPPDGSTGAGRGRPRLTGGALVRALKGYGTTNGPRG
ncbi:hypothetical protein GCM10011583_59180 [Streptomyces camponoticapitis]|uniref:Uncharacterized protein n=1 Tax=Streptomyces camponoticapitis TaxID=1616125 RepID=A0ABQ2ET50_9ACTN|nr:hypothetical protein GCM10011583_59180 [Streptomyces camponoticapitis]